MRFIKILFGAAAICSVIIAAIFLYVTFFGKDFIERSLSDFFGSRIKFKSVSLNLEKSAVSLGNFSIENELALEKKIFNAEVFTLKINKAAFEKEKKVIFDEITVERAVVNVERKPDGKISLILPVPPEKPKGQGASGEKDNGSKDGLYNFVKTVRKVSIKNSIVRFWDYSVSSDPFLIRCERLSVEMASDPEAAKENGYIPVKIVTNFEVPNAPYPSGTVYLGVDMKVYKPFFETNIKFAGRDIDIDHIKPYLDLYTPFIFNKGSFSMDLDAAIASNNIDAFTTIVFHTLRVGINPRKQDSEFLETSVNRLMPYLTSSQGEVAFDFVIRGPLSNPTFGMGPKLKAAAGMAVRDEVAKYIQAIQ